MAGLKHIKNLNTGNVNMFDLIASFVFGKVDIDIYRPEKTYYENDTIIRVNPLTGKYEVYSCKDTTTGSFNIAKWTTSNVHDSTNGQFIDSYTLLSRNQPADTLNRVWLQQVNTRGTIDPDTFLV